MKRRMRFHFFFFFLFLQVQWRLYDRQLRYYLSRWKGIRFLNNESPIEFPRCLTTIKKKKRDKINRGLWTESEPCKYTEKNKIKYTEIRKARGSSDA